MRHRKLLAAMSVGALTVVGGMAAGPGNGQGEGPPSDSESQNGCNGINQAREHVEDTPAADTIEDVADLISDNNCGANGNG
jgi:hypothetical protein